MKDLKQQIIESLNSRARCIFEHRAELAATAMREMEDAPDQQVMPLTREQLAKLLASYESRYEDEVYGNFSRERSLAGSLRARKYMPDASVDWEYNGQVDNETQENPGKQEPWEFVIDPTPIGYEAPDTDDDDDDEIRVGGMGAAVKESTEVITAKDSSELVLDALKAACEMGGDVKLELEDGNDLYLSPEDIENVLKTGMVKYMIASMSDLHSISSFFSTNHHPVDVTSAGEVENEE